MRIIAGEARGRRIRAPEGTGTRPALDRVRESLFTILGDLVEGAEVLDLFAGSGAFGLEAVSRGARSATFVEREPKALEALARNLQELGFLARGHIIQGDALYRPSAGKSYDLIFVDPPFLMFQDQESSWSVKIRVEGLLDGLLNEGGRLLLRHPPKHHPEFARRPYDQRTFGASTVVFFSKP
jgi:16S rRNA (guanine966-N2)-methyltransferase